MRGWLDCFWPIALATVLSACGGSSTDEPGPDLLDPSIPHYGKTYAEWAVEWARYTYRVAPPECAIPYLDESGKDCLLYQDPESPVFFLVGVFGGVARRGACQVPKDKALFFPIVDSMADNAGVPLDDYGTETDHANYVTRVVEATDADELRLSVDGHSIAHLERGVVPATRYEVSLKANANLLTCAGAEDVEGDFPGYVGGHWALLPALGPGAHSIKFGGRVESDESTTSVFIIDVEYHFTL